jgi:hypothetical protein
MRRALARHELRHRSILSPAPDGPDPVEYRPQIRPVLSAPWLGFFAACPQRPFFAPSNVFICREKASTATGIRSQPPRNDFGLIHLQIDRLLVRRKPLPRG